MFKLGKFTKMHRFENKQILEYFDTCMDSINETNLFMLRRVCMYFSIAYGFMLLTHRLLVEDFRLNIAHVMMIPLLLVYFLINLRTRKNPGKVGADATGVICCTFYFLASMIFIMIDTVPFAQSQAFWLPLMILIFPVLYTDRMYKYGMEELLVIVIYIIEAYRSKPDHELLMKDVYLLFSAYVVSMLSAHMLLEMRSREGLAVKELRKLSSLDKLTHVLNKGALISRIETYFMNKQEDEPSALCIIDLDDFKHVNDNLGHSTGDILLERVGQLLIENFRAYDIIGRYGGDEFVVLMPNMGDISILQMRCRTLQMFLTDITFGNTRPFSVSIGAVISTKIRNYDTIFRLADDALYKSKLDGKNRSTVWFFDDKEYDKPIILSVRTETGEGVKELYADKGQQYEILTENNSEDALSRVSQYQSQLKLIIIEMDASEVLGESLLKYVKTRESFAKIPVLAIAKDEESSYLAKDLEADEVLLGTAPKSVFKQTVESLLRR